MGLSVNPKGVACLLVFFIAATAIWQVAVSGKAEDENVNARRLQESNSQTTAGPLAVWGWQLLFAILFYLLIVQKYPSLGGSEPTQAAREIQSKNAVAGCAAAQPVVCIHSCCCFGPRHALTMHATGVMDYWIACVLTSLFPCLFMIYSQACTDLNPRLGGQQENPVSACFCSLCCSCCLIAQDAESLDLITGVRTKLCGVEGV